MIPLIFTQLAALLFGCDLVHKLCIIVKMNRPFVFKFWYFSWILFILLSIISLSLAQFGVFAILICMSLFALSILFKVIRNLNPSRTINIDSARLKRHMKNMNKMSKYLRSVDSNFPKSSFSMKDAEHLKNSALSHDVPETRTIAHHILMQDQHYNHHFILSMAVVSRCIHVPVKKLSMIFQNSLHDSAQQSALNQINQQIENYNSKHPHNTIQKQIAWIEQNNSKN